MSRKSRYALSLIFTLVACAVVVYTIRTKPTVQVSTAPVTDGPMTRHIVATGSLQAVTTVEIGSQESGIVASLLVDYNSFVHAGDVVARLDPSLYDAQYQAAQAALGEANAALMQARANVLGVQAAVDDAQSKLTRALALVSYTAIVDVANPDQRLRPGMTAEVVVSESQRDHVVRIPNIALSFRPPPEVLKAIGETEPAIAKEQGSGKSGSMTAGASHRSRCTPAWPTADGRNC